MNLRVVVFWTFTKTCRFFLLLLHLAFPCPSNDFSAPMIKYIVMGLRGFFVLAAKIWSFLCYCFKRQIRSVSNNVNKQFTRDKMSWQLSFSIRLSVPIWNLSLAPSSFKLFKIIALQHFVIVIFRSPIIHCIGQLQTRTCIVVTVY